MAERRKRSRGDAASPAGDAKRRTNVLHPSFKPNFLDLLHGLGERGFYKGLDPTEIVRLRIEAWLTAAADNGEYARLRGFDRNEAVVRGTPEGSGASSPGT